MGAPEVISLDFETKAIEARPVYPPKPVGLAVKWPGQPGEYLSWGHPTGNNCVGPEAATAKLQAAKASGLPLLFHNPKFDLDVAETHLGVKLPWDRVQDSLVLAFLNDPYSKDLGLKPLAAKHLSMPPDEMDDVRQWLVDHGVINASLKKEWGAYISEAPGDLVGRYAVGDTERSAGIWSHMWAEVVDNHGMLEAYERELQLMPILLENERQGVRVDLERLQRDTELYQETVERVDKALYKLLGTVINVDSGAELGAALFRLYPNAPWRKTPTGKLSTAKDALVEAVPDKMLLALLQYRASVKTCLNTFMVPWLRTALATGGRIYTQWNQTKQEEEGGARTGRLSSSPNFQNIPTIKSAKFIKVIELWEELLKALGYPPLPQVRGYIIADDDDSVLIDRDFCFHPSMEILSDTGWVSVADVTRKTRLAQYRAGEITYSVPNAVQHLDYDGQMHSITGTSISLHVTEDHRCYLERYGMPHVNQFYKAQDYPVGSVHWQQPHAGVLSGGSQEVLRNSIIVSCALQADARVVTTADGVAAHVRWKLKKQRKIDRLEQALITLGVPYVKPDWSDEFTWIVVAAAQLEPIVAGLVRLTPDKMFSRELLQLSPATRIAFIEELAFWDGAKATNARTWSYATTSKHNADLVQELCAVTGFRSVSSEVLGTYSTKPCYIISIRPKQATSLRHYTRTSYHYTGRVHCVSMPWSTVVVRHNGRVAVTGQCQQELRVLAHFEDDLMLQMYIDAPDSDLHEFARLKILELTGISLTRKQTKNIAFGLLYGMGLDKLALTLGVDKVTAAVARTAYLNALPGVKAIQRSLEKRAKCGGFMRTWGGRCYYVEPPRVVAGRMRDFGYKMFNYLIQGSSADYTKEALISYGTLHEHGRLMLSVHDELLASVPRKHVKSEMALMKRCMESMPLDVPMLSDGSIGTNWAEMEDYHE